MRRKSILFTIFLGAIALVVVAVSARDAATAKAACLAPTLAGTWQATEAELGVLLGSLRLREQIFAPYHDL